jgi:4-hydroxy-2-oxoheptanedioate aldolase
MVNGKEQAEALVDACRYPPQGKRSNGPVRIVAYGEVSDYQATANDEILVLPMIETQEALDNLDAILDVPGIDGIYIGPSDLGFSLGFPPKLDREEPEILAIYERLVRESTKRGLFPCVHNSSPAYAARMIQMGFRLVTVGSDLSLMTKGARETVASVRKDMDARVPAE